MLLSLYLRNFRNFEEELISFDPKLNVFYGSNAQGKTNLLEAISLISTGRSFRTQHMVELIREGASFFFLEARILKDNVAQTIRISFDGKDKRVECNASHYPSFQSLLGLLPSVLFILPDIDLIAGTPAARRRFVNLHLSQSDPLYFHHWQRFWRATKHRNSLLRTSSFNEMTCFEHEMSVSAAYLLEKRKLFFEELNQDLVETCQTLSSENISLQYIPSQPLRPPLKDSYFELLQKNRSREKLFGLTLNGPHRDDFSLFIDSKNARLYASEGQKRTAIAAISLSEWAQLKRQLDASPIFGVDDLELHLDIDRRNRFRIALETLGQVFITTPQKNPDFPNAKFYQICSGSVQK